MHIPMTHEEIACFFETSQEAINKLWMSGQLNRSIYDEKRPSALLSRSSVFDVIELALWSGELAVRVSKSDASMWVFYLCEMCDLEPWSSWNLTERSAYLLEAAKQDGLQIYDQFEAARIASTVIATHVTLLSICADNDTSLQLFENQFANHSHQPTIHS